jgi:hypothetical protein
MNYHGHVIQKAEMLGGKKAAAYRKLCTKKHENDIIARFCRKCKEPLIHKEGFAAKIELLSGTLENISAVKVPEGVEEKIHVIDSNNVFLKCCNGPYISFDFREQPAPMPKSIGILNDQDTILCSTPYATYIQSNEGRIIELSNAAFINSCIADNFNRCRELYEKEITQNTQSLQLFSLPDFAIFAWDSIGGVIWDIHNKTVCYSMHEDIRNLFRLTNHLIVVSQTGIIKFSETGAIAATYTHSCAIVKCISADGFLFFLDADGYIQRIDAEGDLTGVLKVQLEDDAHCDGICAFPGVNTNNIIAFTANELHIFDIFRLTDDRPIQAVGAFFKDVIVSNDYIVCIRQNIDNRLHSLIIYDNRGTYRMQYGPIRFVNDEDTIGITDILFTKLFYNSLFSMMAGRDGNNYLVKMEA